MGYKIREIRKNEYPILSDFLYEAVFIPEGMDTPSFAISLYAEYRNMGISTALMRDMIELLKNKGYKQTSLSVQKANYAVRMYQKVGFEVIDENEEEYIMVCQL